MDGCILKRNVGIINTILDKGVIIEENISIGENLEEDKEKYFISDNIIVINKGLKIDKETIAKLIQKPIYF
jgi:ADP-glucose pyrophosphorylase